MQILAWYACEIEQYNGDESYIVRGVNPTTAEGKKQISDWFATAAGGTALETSEDL